MSTAKEKVSSLTIEALPLKESDIEQLAPILVQHVRNRKTQELETGEIEDIQRYMRGGIDKDEGRTRKYLVARDQAGKVWGCMAYSTPDKDMKAHFGVEEDDTVELLNAFVSNEVFRGGGIGKKLFEAICTAAKLEGKRQIVIHSGPRYRKSWGFYDKMCGTNTGVLVGKYGDPGEGDAMTWKKEL